MDKLEFKEPIEDYLKEAVEDLQKELNKPIKISYKKLLESELKENQLLKERIKTLEARHKLDEKRIKTLEATIENLFNKE